MFRTKNHVQKHIMRDGQVDWQANGRALADAAHDRVETGKESAREAAATARETMSESAREAADAARQAVATALREAADRARPAVESALESAVESAQATYEDARPKVEAKLSSATESTRSTLVDTVLPKLGALLGAAATALAQRAEQARETTAPVVESAVHQVRAQVKDSASTGGERARDAYKVLRGQAVVAPLPSKKSRAKWFIAVGVVAAGAAAFAAFRKQQHQQKMTDPWANPYVPGTDSSMAAPAGARHDVTSVLGDPTGNDLLWDADPDLELDQQRGSDDAIETGSDLKNAAATKVEQAKRAASSVMDRADRATEPTDDTGAHQPSQGEVTAVDASLDSDAITGDALEGRVPGGVAPVGTPRARKSAAKQATPAKKSAATKKATPAKTSTPTETSSIPDATAQPGDETTSSVP